MEQTSVREKLLGFKGPTIHMRTTYLDRLLSDKHERIAHAFILTTVNPNQFSTNKIQFYWNNICKNRALARWNVQVMCVCVCVRLYVFITAAVQIEI